MKLLVPVDGSEEALRALDHTVALSREGLALKVHLLNVQAPFSADVARFIARDVIAEHHDEHAQAALADAKARLAASGLDFEVSVAIGSAAQSIVDAATEHACDGIVMGTSGAGSITGMLLGSTATKVVHLAALPVTLVP